MTSSNIAEAAERERSAMSEELYPGKVVREGPERECGGGSGRAESSLAAPHGCATCGKEASLTAAYPMWRFMWWLKAKNLTYTQIDELVNKGEIVPCDCHMQ